MQFLNKIKEKIRSNRFYYKYMQKYWYAVKIYLPGIILYRSICPKHFYILNDKKTVYIVNCKVACSSITASLHDITLSNNESYSLIHKLTMNKRIHFLKKMPDDINTFYKFTYVRNPFIRLVSCYNNRVIEEDYFYNYLLGYLRKIKDFDSFVKKIYKIPVMLMDEHFYPQYNLIYDKKGDCLVNYVGKFETLPNDYNEKIADVYGFNQLPHYNKSEKSTKRWEDYYTIETANLVYEKYKKDFEVFGYEDSYKKLIDYLNATIRQY